MEVPLLRYSNLIIVSDPSNMDKQSFSHLLAIVQETGQLYEDLVYIGGIAVYLHAVNHEQTREFAEATHDADFYISLANLGDLRSIEEVTTNKRLAKQEFHKSGFAFDVYAERQSDLPVPYSTVAAHAVEYDGVKVAALEELLVLKLAAAVDRHASEHGRKDAKDAIRILILATEIDFDPKRAAAFMSDKHFDRLSKIVDGPEFIALAHGNAKVARGLREK
ncbi:MAG TPA: hypothetical protein VN259_04585, partial [Xanthomonadales bacterium]|nr:hypothetical protein [Xanthomonadales bacterium]